MTRSCWMQLWTPSWCADPPPWTTRSICAWTEATTTQRARPQCATTNTSVTLASVPDSLLMRQTGSGIRRGVGLSSAPSRGCRSSEAFWSDTRCMTRTTSGYCNSRALSSGPASGTLSKHRPLIEIDSKSMQATPPALTTSAAAYSPAHDEHQSTPSVMTMPCQNLRSPCYALF